MKSWSSERKKKKNWNIFYLGAESCWECCVFQIGKLYFSGRAWKVTSRQHDSKHRIALAQGYLKFPNYCKWLLIQGTNNTRKYGCLWWPIFLPFDYKRQWRKFQAGRGKSQVDMNSIPFKLDLLKTMWFDKATFLLSNRTTSRFEAHLVFKHTQNPAFLISKAH